MQLSFATSLAASSSGRRQRQAATLGQQELTAGLGGSCCEGECKV